MKNMTAFLASSSSFGITFAIVFTSIVVLMFVAFVIALWWVDVKKKSLKELWKTIGRGFYNFFDKINDVLTSNSSVRTVYSDKSLNFSGTEFLPVPTKAPTDKYVYEFVGWDKNGVDKDGNFVVRAIYLQRVIKCYINIYDDDKATLLKSEVVEYGAGVNLSNLKPTKPETKEFSYEFVGWDKDTSAFYGNTNVCAVYKAIPKKYTYTFFNEDGTTIVSQGSAIYGTPIIAPTAPQKESTNKAVYEFVGWKNYSEGMLLTKDSSFVATYEKKIIDSEVSSSVIKADGTIVRAQKKNQNIVADSVPVKQKSETKSFELDKDELLQGSVGAQIGLMKKAASNVPEKQNNFKKSTQTQVLTPSETENILQKIELVSNKKVVKDESDVPVVKDGEVKVENNEPELLPNMVVNHIKINKKK